MCFICESDSYPCTKNYHFLCEISQILSLTSLCLSFDVGNEDLQSDPKWESWQVLKDWLDATNAI